MLKYLICSIFLFTLSCSSSFKSIKIPSNSATSCITINFDESIKKARLRGIDSITNNVIKKLDIDPGKRDVIINVKELKWYCPEHSKIQGEGFAVGLLGGLVGGAIWGEKNFTNNSSNQAPH